MGLPLENVRVLDLTRAYSGPIGTLYLADLGADVIKVEAVTRPDIPTREMNPAEFDPGEKPWERAAYFHRLNVGKRDITLDLTTEVGKDLFRRLVGQCDVVTENYNPQTMERFGLHYDALKALNPGIIMASMSGFGATGPRKNWAAYNPAMESMGGLTAITGYESGDTIGSQTGYGDWSLGTVGAISILSALHYRNRTGKGQHIDISGREAVISAIGEVIADFSLNGKVRKPSGNRRRGFAPHDTYRCQGQDEWVAICVRHEMDWQAFCDVLGNPEWTRQQRFGDSTSREENQENLRTLIEQWTSTRAKGEAARLLLAAGVPAGPVLDPGEALFDEQLMAREFFEPIHHPEVGTRLFPRQVPAHYSAIERRPRPHPPLLGEHNHEVLGELLGLTTHELRDLEKDGVIGNEPRRKSARPSGATQDTIQKRGGKVDGDYLQKLADAYGIRPGTGKT